MQLIEALDEATFARALGWTLRDRRVPRGAWEHLRPSRLRWAVRSGLYRADRLQPRTRVKADGGLRVLSVPSLRDRVVQRAVWEVVRPRVEAALAPQVAGGLRARGPAASLRRLAADAGGLPDPRLFMLDIAGLFDRLRHRDVVESARRFWPDPLWVWLVREWVSAWPTSSGRGLPQGAPLSPALSHLVLADVLDRQLDRWRSSGELVAWARYMDDVALVTNGPDGARAAQVGVPAALGAAGLAVAAHKSRVLEPGSQVLWLGRHLAWVEGPVEVGRFGGSAPLYRLVEGVRALQPGAP